MYEKFREKLDELFENGPQTNRAKELKEELLANLMDKYNDLVSSGKKQEEAFNITISGIGDIDELIRELKEKNVFDYGQSVIDRKKNALILSISIGMYIMGVVILILCTEVLNINENVDFSSSNIIIQTTDELKMRVVQKSSKKLSSDEKFIVTNKDNEVAIKRSNSHRIFSIFNFRNSQEKIEL